MTPEKRRVAIIGAGVASLVAGREIERTSMNSVVMLVARDELAGGR